VAILTYEKAKELFDYDKKSGLLFAKIKVGSIKAGRIVGNQRGDGALSVSIKGKTILVHRIAWLLHYKEWPQGFVRHINGDKTDNRIENLKCVMPYTDTRGVKEIAGISFVKKTERWKAIIHHNGRQHYLGEYVEKENAVLARLAAEECLGLRIEHEKSAKQWIERNL